MMDCGNCGHYMSIATGENGKSKEFCPECFKNKFLESKKPNFDPRYTPCHELEKCLFCGFHLFYVGYRLTLDNVNQPIKICSICFKQQSIKKEIPKTLKSEYVLISSYRKQKMKDEKCGVWGCLRDDLQEHHILPGFIDRDLSSKYPTIYLCSFHHKLWHDTVTPYMTTQSRLSIIGGWGE